MKTVTLTIDQARAAAVVGLRRHYESRKQNLQDARERLPVVQWKLQDVLGALGEQSACIALGREWERRINNFHDADISQRAQVRTTRYRLGRLIVRPDDDDDHYFILVVGEMPPNRTFTVVGYIKGEDAKQKRWLDQPRGIAAAYFVPQRDLIDL